MREAVVTAIEVKPERSAGRHLRDSLKKIFHSSFLSCHLSLKAARRINGK